MNPTKDHYAFAIEQLQSVARILAHKPIIRSAHSSVMYRIQMLEEEMAKAPVSASQSVHDAHVVLNEYKGTNAKETYNIDPGLMYAMGISAEAGELLNNLIKVFRRSGLGENQDLLRQGVVDELPDVYIYMTLLAMYYDIDLEGAVRAKSEIVVRRALDGHYGPPVNK